MNTARTEIFSHKYNLQKKDNLDLLPAEPAVYGIFAIIDGEPVHCRHTGYTQNLQAAIRSHFETESNPGLKTFMQGPWLKLLLYTSNESAATEQEFQKILAEWEREFAPACDADGEYEPEAAMSVSV